MRKLSSPINVLLLFLVLLLATACGAEYGPSPTMSSGPTSSKPSSNVTFGVSHEDQVAPTPLPVVAQSPLMAGHVDDNNRFPEYLDYLRSYSGPTVHAVDVEQRLYVRLVDGDQRPVAGARVQLFDGQRQVFDGRTVSDGRVLFFPNAAGAAQTQRFSGVASRGQFRADFEVSPGGPSPDLVLGGPTAGTFDNAGPVGIDLVFLLDATGSMGDEIDRIKATIGSIASRIEQLPGSSRPRLGLVAYRDRGDAYVTQHWDFTDDVNRFSQNLAQVSADGGGDEPESVCAGLQEAINLPGWSDVNEGRHVRMIVLVGDAAPHLDYPDEPEYTGLLAGAVAEGIKVFPIGASGLGDQGEYIFRQFAQITQGRFVFLTYANGMSGAPGSATDHHVSNFGVQNLDSLVVGLVAAEVANQSRQPVDPGFMGSVSSDPSPGASPPPAASEGIWVLTFAVLAVEMIAGSVGKAISQVTNVGPGFWVLVLGLVVLVWRRASRGESDLELSTIPSEAEAALARGLDRARPESYRVPVRRARARQHLDGHSTGVWAGEAVLQAEGQLTVPLGSLPDRYVYQLPERRL